MLPIEPFRERILAALKEAGVLILSAPTGSGKSTQTPQFLMGAGAGTTLVLEPRRIAARSLATRVAAETGTKLGGEIGYQVRFDNRSGSATKVLFQTYGVFVQRLLKDPDLKGVGAVILDEFHERTLDTDLSLAWLKALRRSRPELRVVVMSATLDAGELQAYLPGAARVDVPGRLFPVDVRHLPLDARAGPPEGALEALKALAREGLDGSVLVFMPGLREIRRCLTVLGPYCREQGLQLRALHGSMDLAEQQEVLEAAGGPRVILTTNVAETGLTVPGVTMVIDSGLHRLAAHDPARAINTLYVSRISMSNAAQRAGRAGRTAPGRCVRLWSKSQELGMPASIAPEILRLELGSLRLEASSLPGPVDWPTPPREEAWASAGKSLAALGAVDERGAITARGRALLRYPLSPRLAAVLEEARGLGEAAYDRACAMAAVFESDRRPDRSADLEALAEELARGSRDELSRETAESYRQLKRLTEAAPGSQAPEGSLARVWLKAFADRLASRETGALAYKLADGRGVLLPGVKDPPPLILALDVRERAGGGQAKQVSAALFLPCDAASVAAAFPDECSWTLVSEFDERQKRVVKEERLVFRGLVLERRELTPKRDERKATAELWAEKFASGELRHPGLDERVQQLLTRIALARSLYPDMGYPEMSADDWRLVYGEACAGRNSLKDIERVPLEPHVLSYLGPALAGFLERALPASRKLPSGKSGKFFYSEARPPELSARLGDLLKMPATLTLCEGRLRVVFDILAPNYRTVQKTDDLGSFWKNTYPTVKKELQRRYPRHPWP